MVSDFMLPPRFAILHPFQGNNSDDLRFVVFKRIESWNNRDTHDTIVADPNTINLIRNRDQPQVELQRSNPPVRPNIQEVRLQLETDVPFRTINNRNYIDAYSYDNGAGGGGTRRRRFIDDDDYNFYRQEPNPVAEANEDLRNYFSRFSVTSFVLRIYESYDTVPIVAFDHYTRRHLMTLTPPTLQAHNYFGIVNDFLHNYDNLINEIEREYQIPAARNRYFWGGEGAGAAGGAGGGAGGGMITPPRRQSPRRSRRSARRRSDTPNNIDNEYEILPHSAAAAAAQEVGEQLPAPLQLYIAELLLHGAIRTNMTCPISLEPIRAIGCCVSNCGHIFNTSCLDRWARENTRCPVCRASPLVYRPIALSHPQEQETETAAGGAGAAAASSGGAGVGGHLPLPILTAAMR
jgi:Ring finger domain